MRTLVLLAAIPVLLAACSPASRCNATLSGGSFAEAETCFRQALAADPGSSRLQYGLGMALFRQKSYAEAAGAFRKALAEAPGNPDATFRLGLSYLGAGQPDKALETLRLFDPPFRHYERQAVLDEAQRLSGLTPGDTEAAIRRLEDARERGRQEQDRIDTENNSFRRCPGCDGPGWWL